MNLTILVGRTTKDIEIRTTASGTTVANFTLAVDRYSKGEKTADFISCVAYNTQTHVHRIGELGRAPIVICNVSESQNDLGCVHALCIFFGNIFL